MEGRGERGGGGVRGVKAFLQLANFILDLETTLNTEIHKNSVRIEAPNSVNASKRKHKNQNNYYNKQRRVPVKFQKDRSKTVGGVALTMYILNMHFHSIIA